jgi:uncharacterized protein YbaR (Trm112 family)
MDVTVCPKCKSDEDTVMYDSELAYELRLCEKCNLLYEVFYKTVAYEIKIKGYRNT